jgi:hypothetical protein
MSDAIISALFAACLISDANLIRYDSRYGMGWKQQLVGLLLLEVGSLAPECRFFMRWRQLSLPPLGYCSFYTGAESTGPPRFFLYVCSLVSHTFLESQ